MQYRLVTSATGRPYPHPLHLAGRNTAQLDTDQGTAAKLLTWLEVQLGLTGHQPSLLQRAAQIQGVLREHDGFHQASFGCDPVGVARTLISWRDTLMLHGWRADPSAMQCPRLRTLATVTAAAGDGLAGRIAAASAALEVRKPRLQRIEILGSLEVLPPAFQRLIERLETQAGVKLEPRDFAPPHPEGRRLLVRPHGPLLGARDVAQWLASRDDQGTGPRPTLFINPGPELDRALEQVGLPRCGVATPGDNPLLRLLPLTLAMNEAVPDPQRAFELLAIPGGPLSASLSRRLRVALLQQPGVGGPNWAKALKKASEEGKLSEPDRRKLTWLFAPGQPLADRVQALANWANTRGHASTPTSSTAGGQPTEHCYLQLADACETFLQLIEQIQTDNAQATRERLCDLALEEAGECPSPDEAQARAHAVGDPADIAWPADTDAPLPRVVWWGFEREQLPRISAPVPLNAAERTELAEQGVVLPTPGALAQRRAETWRRPLISDELIMVCPARGIDGEAVHPHPLWDELSLGATEADAHRVRQVRSLAQVDDDIPMQPAPLARQPKRVTSVTVPPGSVPQRKRESANSIMKLVGCPLQYAIEYGVFGRGPKASVATLPGGPLLLGNFGHHVIQEALLESRIPEEIPPLIKEVFDRDGPGMAAPLFLRSAETDLDNLRIKFTEAALAVARALAGREGTLSMERKIEGELAGAALAGRADVVFKAADPSESVVIDLKLGGASKRRAELDKGCAVQLAIYAACVGTPEAPVPDVAYVILNSGDVLAASGSHLAEARVSPGPGMADTWRCAEATFQGARAEVDAGRLAVLGNVDEPVKSTHRDRDDGLLRNKPGCMYCDHSKLCANGLEVTA